jgi:hypothetical protein
MKRKVTAANRGTGGSAITPAPSDTEVSTLARNAGIDPSKVGGVVVVQSQSPHDVQGQAEVLATRFNGKVISVSPAMESTGQILFVEVPQEYAASFKLGLQQDAASFRLSTNKMVAALAPVTTNAGLLSATSTARVAGVTTSGAEVKSASLQGKLAVETNAVFNGLPQLSLANNPQAQAAAMTILEILVVPPPSFVPTNPTPAAAPRTP